MAGILVNDAVYESRMRRIGGRMKAARLAAGLDQDYLSLAVGFANGSVISRIEAGRYNLSTKQLLVLADVLGVSVAWLSGESDAGGPA